MCILPYPPAGCLLELGERVFVGEGKSLEYDAYRLAATVWLLCFVSEQYFATASGIEGGLRKPCQSGSMTAMCGSAAAANATNSS
jgi:hypothetical protein